MAWIAERRGWWRVGLSVLAWGNAMALLARPASLRAQEDESSENLSGERSDIRFSSVRLDLGAVWRGQKISRSFSFRNNGKAVLDIRSIHSACGCINTKADPKTRFAPGEEGRISFEFDSSWFTGSVLRTITVDSNDPSNPATVLSVVAKVNEEIRVMPALITLGEIPRDTAREFTASVELLEKAIGEEIALPEATLQKFPPELESVKKELAAPPKELKILAAVSSSPHMNVEILGNEGRTRTLRMRFKGPLPSGPFRERITLWNTSSHLKELIVPVVGEVLPHVKPSTRYLEFGATRISRTSRRVLGLESALAGFKVESVGIELRPSEPLKGLSGDAVLSHQIEKTQNGYNVTLEMRVPAGLKFPAAPVNVSGSVVVKTNDPDVKELKVPFFGVLIEEKKP